MDNPGYDKEQALSAQKSFLERKRNRLNGIIELITDVMKGVHTMSFGAFSNEEAENYVRGESRTNFCDNLVKISTKS